MAVFHRRGARGLTVQRHGLVWAKSNPGMSLPLVGPVVAWQLAFIAVGLPGFFLAVLFFVLREPKRQEMSAAKGLGNATLLDTLKFIHARWKTFACFLSIFCLMTTIAYSQGWCAALLCAPGAGKRQNTPSVNGIVLLAVGPAAVNLSAAVRPLV